MSVKALRLEAAITKHVRNHAQTAMTPDHAKLAHHLTTYSKMELMLLLSVLEHAHQATQLLQAPTNVWFAQLPTVICAHQTDNAPHVLKASSWAAQDNVSTHVLLDTSEIQSVAHANNAKTDVKIVTALILATFALTHTTWSQVLNLLSLTLKCKKLSPLEHHAEDHSLAHLEIHSTKTASTPAKVALPVVLNVPPTNALNNVTQHVLIVSEPLITVLLAMLVISLLNLTITPPPVNQDAVITNSTMPLTSLAFHAWTTALNATTP